MEDKKIKKSVGRKLSAIILLGLESFFYRFGHAVACHPWSVILGCLGFVALSSFGILRFHQEKHPIKLWVPKNSDFIHDTNWLTSKFREGYRIQSILITAPNVLEPQVLQKLQDIQNKVENLNADGITWEDICFRIPVVDFNFKRRKRDVKENLILAEDYVDVEEDFEFDLGSILGYDLYCNIINRLETACMQHSLLELWKFNEQKIHNLTEEKIIKALNRTTVSPVYGHPTDYLQLLGNVRRNETGHVTGASALLSLYMVHIDFMSVNFDEDGNEAGTADWATKPILKWEQKFMDMMEDVSKHAQGIEVFYEAGRSFADISAASMFQDINKLIVGIILMFIYVQINVSKFNMVECRLILGSVGLLCILMAFVVACGFCSLLGISYGPVHTALPFLLLGIGVDDLFVIVTCWKNLNVGNNLVSLPEKMGQTMRRAGVSITITTLTDVAAFLVGALTILPSLQSFCLYAAAGLLMTYIFQTSFFVACFVLDERRIKKNRNCALICYKHRDYKPNPCSEVEYSKPILYTVYSKAVFTKPGKLLVILLTLGFAAVGLRGSLLLKQKFDLNWFLAEDTHLYKFNMERAKFFPDMGHNAGIYFGGLNYSAELPNIHRLVAQLKQEENILKNLEEWYSEFQSYVKLNLKKDISTDIISDDEFSIYISKYLFSPHGSKYQKNFRFDGKLLCGQPAPPVTVASFEFKFRLFDGPEEFLPAMHKVKKLLYESNFTTGDRFSTVWGKILANWVTDEVIDTELYRNLGLACICVMVCTMLLIVNIVACLFVFFCVLLTLVSVGGFLYYWGLTIDTTTCIGLQLATGLCVDYAAHMCLAFLSQTGSRSVRALKTVTDIGPAIFNGGISTLLALSMLSLSHAYIFTSFFKIFFLVILFGLFYGTLFLPVLLSFIGPQPYESSQVTEPQTEAVKVYSLCDAEPS
ncbi:protein patched homolog 3-like [Zootermopsis nevadensis]|uniref:Patched domain-containing protein 3 n=1 Tax=Zootermopsis nevadensis TaxID=136037 RepID=A0A067QS63_ZOONE|nr:protein patched homolog 3-like [Zootermopsis nevadensis]XP_021932461.1 protein patched homolog 3-like [Zootermopsis nevadensis]KDR12704.1 Patched domain-containing protein 3 [Zootermopsis nevadensis]